METIRNLYKVNDDVDTIEEDILNEAVDARKKGHLSYKFGRKPDQNPYPAGSDDAKDWSAGYSAAKAAEKKRDPRYRAEAVDPQDKGEYDDEGGMAQTQINKIMDAAKELKGIIGKDDNLPEWVQSKMTKASDYIDGVRDYLKNKSDTNEAIMPYTDEEADNLQEETFKVVGYKNGKRVSEKEFPSKDGAKKYMSQKRASDKSTEYKLMVSFVSKKPFESVEEEVELDEAKKFSKSQKEKAIKIIDNPRYKGGNMTKIVKEIEKIARGLSKESEIAYLIKLTNEDVDLDEALNRDWIKAVNDLSKKMGSSVAKSSKGGIIPFASRVGKSTDIGYTDSKGKRNVVFSTDKPLSKKEEDKMLSDIRKKFAKEDVDLDEAKLAGFIANFKGKKLEIRKNEVDSLYGAKKLAIKKLNVPKSQEGLLAIKPAYEEVEWDEERMDIIGQNGNNGEHYEELEEAVSPGQVEKVVLAKEDAYEVFAKGNEKDPMLFLTYESNIIASGSKKDDQFVFGFVHESIHPNRNYQPRGMVHKTTNYTHVGFDSPKSAISFAKNNKITEG